MAYYTEAELKEMGFKAIGKEVKISDKASIYNPELIELGDFSRIDDFCVVSGNVKIGRNVHITPHCLIAGGEPGIVLEDFTTLAYGCTIFSQSDDYSGATLTNSTVPKAYKNEIFAAVKISKHSIVGTRGVIMPGVELGEGTAVGANSLVLKSTEVWSIYAGSPAKKIKDRKQDLLGLEQQYLEKSDD